MTQTTFKNLREAIKAQYKDYVKRDFAKISTDEGLKSLMGFHGKQYKGTPQQIKCKFERFLIIRNNKQLSDDLRQIELIENAPELPNPLIITIEWTRSRMWGMNPTASTNYGFEGSSIGGCGYCKHSTATAQALNACLPILKLLYAKKNLFLGQFSQMNYEQHDINKELFGYGSGYGILPRFEGGVGVECHRRICEKLGLTWENVSDTKHVNVYRISQRDPAKVKA